MEQHNIVKGQVIEHCPALPPYEEAVSRDLGSQILTPRSVFFSAE